MKTDSLFKIAYTLILIGIGISMSISKSENTKRDYCESKEGHYESQSSCYIRDSDGLTYTRYTIEEINSDGYILVK